MPRNRSSSASTSPTLSPALLSRGFASLRRAHRRLSLSSPTPTSPPNPPISPAVNISNPETTVTMRPHIRLVPNVGISNRSFVFEIIDRQLEPGVVYRIGRFSDRNAASEKLSFKSKVISRNHAELWTEDGKVYLKDIGSSSGTFLNRIRLSAPNHPSQAHEIKDGDSIQLGVGYQGGIEPIYRAVRIRVEINRQEQNTNDAYTRTAFQHMCNNLVRAEAEEDLGLHREPTKVQAPILNPHITKADIQECCICLYAIAPYQALFIAPCSHIFHFKCLRPIVFQNYPGFSCPLCRNYFDLEASVAVEVEDVLEAISQAKKDIPPAITDDPPLGAIEEELTNIKMDDMMSSTPSTSLVVVDDTIPTNTMIPTTSGNDTLLSSTLVDSSLFEINNTS